MPKPSFNSGGKRPTGDKRIRNTVFGSVLEERMEHMDGSCTWEKPVLPHILCEGGVKGYCYARRQWGSGRTRIRNGIFGAVVEEMFDNDDGSTTWQRIDKPVNLPGPGR